MESIPSLGVREARARFGPLVNAAHMRNESVIVTRNGTPAAVLIPYSEWIGCHGDESCTGEASGALPSENGR